MCTAAVFCVLLLFLWVSELLAAVEEVGEDLQQDGVSVFITSDEITSSRMKSLNRLVLESSEADVPHTYRSNVSFTSPAVYIYTSGTTGNTFRLLADTFIQIL